MTAYPAGRTAETSPWRRQQPVIALEPYQGNIDRQRPGRGQARKESLCLYLACRRFSKAAMTAQAGQIVNHLPVGQYQDFISRPECVSANRA